MGQREDIEALGAPDRGEGLMTACAHRLLDAPNGSPCTREEHPDHPNDHVYKDSHGSDVADRHDMTSGGEH
jgi:hypothetical protein